ncbi:MAG TPA: serine/threonine-protein kinase [Streptosporangiaceae bacterium]|nr:serine/threonine-protein kinase [Streptosporangiaceae bacterium]
MRVQDRTPERLGPYRVVRQLGQGGMGVVYLAADAEGQPVAVKALHPGMAQEENARRRLAREVETMHRVRSQYVAEVLGADLDGDPPYIVTRYVPGPTLDAVIATGGAMTGPALKRLAYGLAQALHAVHTAGVVHRDLKPGNVMISDGEPVVIDFGIAQLAETTRLTMTGMFMGTPGYLAPEVIEGKDSGAASDVHSWAATLAFAATGRPPFGTGTYEAIFFRIVHGQPDLDTLPLPLRPMVARALARDPVARPTAAELVQWASGLDASALVPSAPGLNNGYLGGSNLDQRTVTDQQGPGAAWPVSTRPLAPLSADDVRDLLPPVNYSGQPVAAVVAGTGPGGPAPLPQVALAPARAALMPQPTGAQLAAAQPGTGRFGGRERPAVAGRGVSAISPWSPLVIASVMLAVAVSVMAPVAGTAVALALFILLRAAAITGRHLSKRAAGSGRAGAALVLFPVSVLRAVLGLLLVAPVALLGACVAIAATIIAVPVHPLPQAVAFGAGALIAIVGLGPGSSGSRSLLASIYTWVARTPSQRAVTYVGVLSVCTWAGVTAWYQSPAAAYWPVISLHAQLEHLPTLRTVITDFRLNLLRLARKYTP